MSIPYLGDWRHDEQVRALKDAFFEIEREKAAARRALDQSLQELSGVLDFPRTSLVTPEKD